MSILGRQLEPLAILTFDIRATHKLLVLHREIRTFHRCHAGSMVMRK